MADTETCIIIFGATGDLAQRKLVPALFHLYCGGMLPARTHVVGFALPELSDDGFREHLWNGVGKVAHLAGQREEWGNFAATVFYVSGDVRKPADFAALKRRLEAIESARGAARRKPHVLPFARAAALSIGGRQPVRLRPGRARPGLATAGM